MQGDQLQQPIGEQPAEELIAELDKLEKRAEQIKAEFDIYKDVVKKQKLTLE